MLLLVIHRMWSNNQIYGARSALGAIHGGIAIVFAVMGMLALGQEAPWVRDMYSDFVMKLLYLNAFLGSVFILKADPVQRATNRARYRYDMARAGQINAKTASMKAEQAHEAARLSIDERVAARIERKANSPFLFWGWTNALRSLADWCSQQIVDASFERITIRMGVDPEKYSKKRRPERESLPSNGRSRLNGKREPAGKS